LLLCPSRPPRLLSLGNLSSFRPVEPGDGGEGTGDGSKNKSTRDDAPQQVPQGWGDGGSLGGWDERASQGGGRTNQEGGLKLLGLANLGAAVRKDANERKKVGQSSFQRESKAAARSCRASHRARARTLFSTLQCSAVQCARARSSSSSCSHDVPHDGGLPSRADSCEAKGEGFIARRSPGSVRCLQASRSGRADLRRFVSFRFSRDVPRVFCFPGTPRRLPPPRAFERAGSGIASWSRS